MPLRRLLHAHARDMRRDAAPAEKLLWSRLRNRQLAGLRFRRQHAITSYIVDFYCAEAALVVEVDGDSHFDTTGEAEVSDQSRTGALTKLGCRVIRFTNTDVFESIEQVLNVIAHACGKTW